MNKLILLFLLTISCGADDTTPPPPNEDIPTAETPYTPPTPVSPSQEIEEEEEEKLPAPYVAPERIKIIPSTNEDEPKITPPPKVLTEEELLIKEADELMDSDYKDIKSYKLAVWLADRFQLKYWDIYRANLTESGRRNGIRVLTNVFYGEDEKGEWTVKLNYFTVYFYRWRHGK